MKLKQYCVIAALFLAAPALIAGSALFGDDVFTDASYEDAAKQAERDGRVLVIDFTAVWCGPCKMMDKNTWSDDSVIEWMDEHGVAVKVDVDKQRAVAKQYNVRAMPTVVVVKDGAEFDRVVGYRGPEQLLDWLNGTLDGETSADQARQAAGDRPEPGEQADMQARLQLAQALVQQGKLAEATDEYVWLWKNMLDHQPAMAGVRLSFMASDMEELAERHEPAMAAFVKLREDVGPDPESGAIDVETLMDWLALCEITGAADAVMNWFDIARQNPSMHPQLQMMSFQLFPVLIEHDRVGDLMPAYPDPVGHAEEEMKQLQHLLELLKNNDALDESQRARVDEATRSNHRRGIGRLYAICLAAGRDNDASAVAARLMAADDSRDAVFALVEHALEAGAARVEQEQWLLGLPPSAERNQLLERVRQQLAQQTTSG